MAKHRFTKDNAKEMGSRGGKKSKRKPHDAVVREWLGLTIKELNNGMISKLAKSLGVSDENNIDDLIRFSLLVQAMKGNVQAAREIYNRGYAPLRQTVRLETEDTDPSKFVDSDDTDRIAGEVLELLQGKTPKKIIKKAKTKGRKK